MPGRFGRTMTAGGWPNLVRIADAALRHYDEICDAAYHYAPYVGASLGWPTPCFNHHRWDWIEVLPYPLIGRIAARRITGYLGGADTERRQRQLLLSAFHNLDGFAYPHYVRGWSEQTRVAGPIRSSSSACRSRARMSAGRATCVPSSAVSASAKIGPPHRQKREERLAGRVRGSAKPRSREASVRACFDQMQLGEPLLVIVVSDIPFLLHQVEHAKTFSQISVLRGQPGEVMENGIVCRTDATPESRVRRLSRVPKLLRMSEQPIGINHRVPFSAARLR